MHITKVELIHKEEILEGTMQDGLPVAPRPESWHFLITTDEESHLNGAEMVVPNEPTNRHYREVAEWYKAQKKKPFKFDFIEL